MDKFHVSRYVRLFVCLDVLVLVFVVCLLKVVEFFKGTREDIGWVGVVGSGVVGDYKRRVC